MGSKKNKVRIVKKHNENYTFTSNNFLNDLNKDNYEPGNIVDDNDQKSSKEIDPRIDKKINSKHINNKGRKIMGKSMQGHSPIYE